MIKSFLILLLIALSGAYQLSSGQNADRIPDGLYIVIRIEEGTTAPAPLTGNEIIVRYSELFEEYNGEVHVRIIVDKNDYVPIELNGLPLKENQTENKKKLLLTLSKSAAEKLKSFSERNLNKTVAIVVGGKVLTKHKIKAVLTEGKLQITRCTDNACELLYDVLKKNIVK